MVKREDVLPDPEELARMLADEQRVLETARVALAAHPNDYFAAKEAFFEAVGLVGLARVAMTRFAEDMVAQEWFTRAYQPRASIADAPT